MSTNSTNMNMPIPTVGVEAGPTWADDINASLLIIDSHNHVPGQGAPIPTQGISIDADFTFNQYRATNIKSVGLYPQTGTLSDTTSIYTFNGDLYYSNSGGTPVQITLGNNVNLTASSIPGLVAPASLVYSAFPLSFIFKSTATEYAYLDCAGVILRNNPTSGFKLTLATPAIPADYTLTLPSLPVAALNIMTIDSSGAMGVTVPNNTITNSGGVLKVADTSLTQAQVAPGYGFILPGMILPYGGAAAPSGYLLCDGASVLKASYADLYAAIADAYGTADATHFNVPDLRGQFLRGVTGASANDPDSAGRTAMNPGGATGNNVGSVQTDAFESHQHTTDVYVISGLNGNFPVGNNNNTIFGSPVNTSLTGGLETRPINAYVNYIIKT